MSGIRLPRLMVLAPARLKPLKPTTLPVPPPMLPVTPPSSVAPDASLAQPHFSPSFLNSWRRFAQLSRLAFTAPALLLLGVPNDAGLSTRRVGTPHAQDLPFLLEHLAKLIQGGLFANHPAIRNSMAMVFDILAALEGNSDDTHRLQAILYARDAARTFKDTRFLDMARPHVERLPQDDRETVITELTSVAAELHPFRLPDHLLRQLRQDTQNQNELRMEETVNLLVAMVMDTCLTLIGLWNDPEKAVSWAEYQIDEITGEIRRAATSIVQRGLVHDAVNMLSLMKSFIRLTAPERPGRTSVAPAIPQIAVLAVSRDLGTMVTSLERMHKSSARITATGFQDEHLVETADGRELFIILRNLVGNARQHPQNRQGPVDIHLTLIRSASGATITVADTGAGMTTETAAHLLAGRPMHDGQAVDLSDPNEFHGFGWPRIREACARLGIVPEINSTPGQGTTVTLHLPRGMLKSDTPRTPAEDFALLNRFLTTAILDRVLLRELTAAQIGPYDPMLDRLTTERRTPDVLRAVARFRLQHQLPGISLSADLSPAATAGALFGQDAPLFWKTMLMLVAGHPSADMRRFAVDMVHGIATRTTGQDKDQLALFTGTALRNSDAMVVLRAWQLNRTTPVIGPGTITAEWLYSHEPAGSPPFGLARYVFGSVSDQAARREALNAIMAASPSQDTRIDLRTVQPLHSLADYNPDDALRIPRLSYNRARIEELLGILGPTQRDSVVTTASFKGGQGFVAVLQFPSGHQLLLNGHHRGAALFQAARDGLIPASWLEDIPVRLYRYNGDMPEALVRRLATLGATLTWDDLLPPNEGQRSTIEAGLDDPQAVGRRDALQMAYRLLPELPNAADRAGLRRLWMRGLKDTNIGVIYAAWSLLTQHHLIDPATVTDDMFTWIDPPPVPQFGLARAFFLSGQLNLNRWARSDFYKELYKNTSIQDAVIPLRTFRPFHNPTYYDPAENISDQARDARLERELGRLQELIRSAALHTPPEQILARFMLGYSDKTHCLIDVLQLPSGWRMMLDGHHRTAVLLTAVRKGIMPAEWLDHIPTSLHIYNGPLPEPYIRRILTIGVTLTWNDFLPPTPSQLR